MTSIVRIAVYKQIVLSRGYELCDETVVPLKVKFLFIHKSLKQGNSLTFTHHIDEAGELIVFFPVHHQPALPPWIQEFFI